MPDKRMIELIASIISVTSLAGIVILVTKKMPRLAELTDNTAAKKADAVGQPVMGWLGERLKRVPGMKDFSYELLLQKVLSRVRVLTLKLENRTGSYLQKLREQAVQKKQEELNDDYWKNLKDIIKTKSILKRRSGPKNPDQANAVVEKVTEVRNGRNGKNAKKKMTMMF